MALGVDVRVLRILRRHEEREEDTQRDRQDDERHREVEGAGRECIRIEPHFDVTCCAAVRVGLLEGLVHAPS